MISLCLFSPFYAVAVPRHNVSAPLFFVLLFNLRYFVLFCSLIINVLCSVLLLRGFRV